MLADEIFGGFPIFGLLAEEIFGGFKGLE